MFENLQNLPKNTNERLGEDSYQIIENINRLLNDISGEFSKLADKDLKLAGLDELSSARHFTDAVGAIISK